MRKRAGGRRHKLDPVFAPNVYAFVYDNGAKRYTLSPVSHCASCNSNHRGDRI